VCYLDRQKLINEVKQKYQELANEETRYNFRNEGDFRNPEKYYEDLLHNAINLIEAGAFDGYENGSQVVEKIAKNKNEYFEMLKKYGLN